ncbi:hypothetical protein BDZ89DRAFT_1133683 [Hymenopellis radicata]|nr:hypothetical protein BDZ89DRAFT_1133683 [Hymenopellis radicata]
MLDTTEGDSMVVILHRLENDINNLSSTIARRFESIEAQLGPGPARSVHERLGAIERRLDDGFDKTDAKLDRIDAKLDNAQKRLSNKHSMAHIGRLTYMLHKIIPGSGLQRAINLLPQTVICPHRSDLESFEPEPTLGAVFDIDASLLSDFTHLDILKLIIFYNETFRIEPADSLLDRKAKLFIWLTVGYVADSEKTSHIGIGM